MKILAIRGKNLASLAEEFEIDLERPPLQGCGLFAISGPTGSGKSTLLDAMCLALFDRIPRLSGRGGPEVGRPDDDPAVRLAAHDVRQVLRRGAGRGYAEVDFRGFDGRRYRAKWTAWRARDRANGAYQNQSVDLIDLDSEQRLGGKKTETLKAIEQKLGLTFEQFCRSALLAQGEFAAFLKADENDRAELLERITGTEIYSRLSKAAYARSKAEREALEKLETEANAIPVLDDGARAEVEAKLQAAIVGETTADVALKSASAQVAWYAQRTKLSHEVALAEGERENAQRAVEASSPARVELERVLQAQGLRHQIEAVDAARKAHGQVAAQHGLDSAALEKATQEHTSALAEKNEREGARDQALSQEEAARPEIEKAEALDAQLVALDGVANDAAVRSSRTAEALRETAETIDSLKRQQTQVASAQAETEAWLAEHRGIEPLAGEWPRWKRALENYGTAWTQARTLEPQRTSILAEAERAAADLAKAQAAEQQTTAALVATQAASEDACTKRDAAPVEAVRSEREAVTDKRARLLRLADLAAQLEEARRAAEENRKSAEEATVEAEAHAAKRTAAHTELARLDVRLEEARRAQENARTAQSQSSLRAQLREGEPCPVCGATEHPLRGESEIDALVASATARVKELEGERTALQTAEGSATADEKAARARAVECARTAAAHTKAGEALLSRWTEERGTDEGLAQDASTLRGLAETLKEQEETLRAEEKHRGTLAEAAARAQRALESARVACDAARGGLRGAEKTALEVEKRKADLDAQLSRLAEVRDDAEAELTAPLSGREGWREALKRDPAALLRACAEDVNAWTARQSALVTAQKNLDALGGKLEAAATLLHERSEEARRAAEASTEATGKRAACAAERAKLLGGQATAAFKAALRSARELAERGLAEATSKTADAERKLTHARARLEESGRRVEETREQLERALAVLADALEKAGSTEDDVRALLNRGQGWIDTTKSELARLDGALTRAQAVFEERQSRRAAHEATDAPALSEEEARTAESAALEAVKAAQAAVAEARAALKQDDEARARIGERRAIIDAQREKAELWRKLDAVIGSASGNAFKVFAQSLTLDALLQPANHHLSELAPRYRLMRVPGNDLALQIVDGDMGEEVRSVSSLSGGESFLVSLALALGLASLSSSRTQVETLFIDEGFGTLDPDTLEIALNTLDSLQSRGRQVGIISHVSGLAERIGVQVRVERLGGGRSRVQVHGPDSLLPAGTPAGQVG